MIRFLSALLFLSFAAGPVCAQTFTVDWNGDEPDLNFLDGVCIGGQPPAPPVGCTLRAAIEQANFLGTPIEIKFGLDEITTTVGFPAIEVLTTFDGTRPGGTRARLELLGGIAFGAGASGSLIKNVEIFGSVAWGIRIATTNVTVQGSYIHDNALAGIEVVDFGDSQIGGIALQPGTAPGNIIANNGGAGIEFDNAPNNAAEGNLIGTDPTGHLPAPNGNGIIIDVPSTLNTRIGGTVPGARNVISGNLNDGIEAGRSGSGPSTNFLIQGNFIGTDINGIVALPNIDDGISLFGPIVLTIGGEESTARNIISGNGGDGIDNTTSDGVAIENNYIGVNQLGAPIGNQTEGIRLRPSVRDNLILDNVISGNQVNGIKLEGNSVEATGHVITGNKVGTDPDGVSALPNGAQGLDVRSSGNVIADGNVISGNTENGVRLFGIFATDNQILGNLIGTRVDGSTSLGNSETGVLVTNGAAETQIGGTEPGNGNTIAFNNEEGIRIIKGTGNAILGNSIFRNGKEGIDLDEDGFNATNDGVTRNDPLDEDDGANHLQNAPVITSVGAGSTIVEGLISSKPNTTYRIEIFSSSESEPDGIVEGEKFLGSASVSTDENGNGGFSETFPGTETNISATATDPDGNTSEFSFESPLVVNTENDAVDSDVEDGVCNTGGPAVEGRPECSLRAAIMEANFRDGQNQVTFDIPGAGPFFINITGSLPTVSDEIIVDATTQEGFDPALPVVQLTGGPASTAGLQISAATSTVKGLIVSRFGTDGISFTGNNELTLSYVHLLGNSRHGLTANNNVRIEGSDGIDAMAAEALNNGQNGLNIEGAATLTATGPIRVNGNGTVNTRPDCGHHAGIFVQGTAVLASVEAASNCGSGLLVEVNVIDGGDLTITGDVLVRDNEGHGIRADGKTTITDGFIRIEDNSADGIHAGSDLLLAGVSPDGSADNVAIRLVNNGLTGASSDFDATLVGKALVQNNGFKKPANFPCFDNRFGAIESQDGAITTDAITVTNNCGSGLIALKEITINGNAVVSDNGGSIGIWGGSGITLVGEAHEISRNGGVAIWSADGGQRASDGKVSVEGLLTVQNNGTNISPQACEASQGFGIEAAVLTDGPIELDDVVVTDNCFTGVWSRRRISIDGNARITGNTGHGIFAGDQLRLSGVRHEISNNGGDGVSIILRNAESTAFGRFEGHVLVRNNNVFSRNHSEDECEFRTGRAGINAPYIPLEFERVTASGNCGTGIIGGDVFVAGNILSNNNMAIGVHATRQVQLATGEVCRNDAYGIWAQKADVGSVKICENGLAGILVQNDEPGAAPKQATFVTASVISGASIENNMGDGISADGASVTVERSNIVGNSGLGVSTLNGSPSIVANDNWWGHVSGPGGTGPGSGDAISTGVEANTWLAESIGLIVSTASDTIYAEPGQQIGISFSYRSWLDPFDEIEITYSDDSGWLQDPGPASFTLSDTLVMVLTEQVVIPPGMQPSQAIISSTATSTSDPAQTDSKSIVVLSYVPELTSILVDPDTLVVSPGGSGRFLAVGVDQAGAPVFLPLEWSAAGGSIDQLGSFLADQVPGFYSVMARDPISGIVGSAIVEVSTSVSVEGPESIPLTLELIAAYPNPSRNYSDIAYSVPKHGRTRILLYNLVGQLVRTVTDRLVGPGKHTERVDVSALSSGIYLVVLEQDVSSRTGKIVVVD